jgi:23S rRNA pseudouridine955/2504/2580 synthase
MKEFEINDNEAGQRFDKYLKKLLCNASGSFVYKMLRKKNIVLNDKKADGTEKLSKGDKVKLFLSDDTFDKFSGTQKVSGDFEVYQALSQVLLKEPERFPVIYEDADVVLINKPVGMLSQKAEPSDISANEYLIAYLIGKGKLTEEMMLTFRPAICNRLDRNTSGILVGGKTLSGLQQMSCAFKERTVQKYYRCIVKGEIKKNARISGFLVKDEVKNHVQVYDELPQEMQLSSEERCLPIETEYCPIRCCNGYTELEVHLITGRSHQIRAHLASIGHPVVGDFKYGERNINDRFRKELQIKNQLLHAYRLEFADGRTVTAPKPTEFEKVWKLLEQS